MKLLLVCNELWYNREFQKSVSQPFDLEFEFEIEDGKGRVLQFEELVAVNRNW